MLGAHVVQKTIKIEFFVAQNKITQKQAEVQMSRMKKYALFCKNYNFALCS
jgi:hypothetical protein